VGIIVELFEKKTFLQVLDDSQNIVHKIGGDGELEFGQSFIHSRHLNHVFIRLKNVLEVMNIGFVDLIEKIEHVDRESTIVGRKIRVVSSGVGIQNECTHGSLLRRDDKIDFDPRSAIHAILMVIY